MDATFEEVSDVFSPTIAELVDDVTKLNKISSFQRRRQAENFRKMILAMSKDLRVILVKLADRTHNMRTLQHLPPPKRDHPRNHGHLRALGQPTSWDIKTELEDLSFAISTLRYQQIKERSRPRF